VHNKDVIAVGVSLATLIESLERELAILIVAANNKRFQLPRAKDDVVRRYLLARLALSSTAEDIALLKTLSSNDPQVNAVRDTVNESERRQHNGAAA
jgi:hypothetical protein